ncbi:hypothetical protein HYH03_002835 [Edaphochlamys debaryana]|uniref:MYND-type domain-containing protein n=1 Tax=Edaphochlamys debaryana TaxID=47281 RepID=A0A836C3M2_9CHLO|nr:hypothetical protein HYH03_002835 [Edaphochlamys debaryana]|eukprot:KAG2499256.1 hypothetical protein HYH03_002835 [Edaphochlamys debaryana]
MSPFEGYRYLELRPVKEGEDSWDADAHLTAIVPTTLPPGDNEAREKAELRRRGWRDPRGLFGYTKDAAYKDLYVYFDAKDHTSPVNVAASKAFRCYGLDGRQGVIDWEAIRGPCVILRGEPPKMTSAITGRLEQMDFPYKPLISAQELVDTLLFFKDRDAHKVALKRDAARAMADFPRNHPMFQEQGLYVSPAGIRAGTKVAGHDAQACAACGKPNSIACSLKACSRCKSVWYCDRDCQKQDCGTRRTAPAWPSRRTLGAGGGRGGARPAPAPVRRVHSYHDSRQGGGCRFSTLPRGGFCRLVQGIAAGR